MGEEESVTVVVSVVIAEGGQHFAGPEGRAGACSACGAADANGLMLRKGGRRPRNVVAFMLAGVWPEVEDSPSEEGTDDRLLKWSDDVGVDGGVHESVLDGVEVVSEDVVVSCDVHVSRHRRRCLICLSGWRREEMGQLSFGLFMNVSV